MCHPKWEFNFGVGVGLTRSTDHLIFKMIIGRRLTFGHKQPQPANPPTDLIPCSVRDILSNLDELVI